MEPNINEGVESQELIYQELETIETLVDDKLDSYIAVQKQRLELLSKLAKEKAELTNAYLEIVAGLTQDGTQAMEQARLQAKESKALVEEAREAYREAQRLLMYKSKAKETDADNDTMDDMTQAMAEVLQQQELGISQSAAKIEAMLDSNSQIDTHNLETDVIVTVICVTFRHEKYISEALDSFLMQKTNFKFQVFVGEDCGGDGTADIILDYAKRYPDIIIPFLRETNMGPQRNALDMCKHATSPFIAFCDGDDYWVDEYKLQKQVDYMNQNPTLRFSFARTEIMHTDSWPQASFYKKNKDGRYIFPEAYPGLVLKEPPLLANDFISNAIGHTSSLIFRWDYSIEFPNWFFEGVMGDIPLKLIQLGSGQAGYIPDVVSAYRINETGVYTGFKNNDEMFLKTRPEYIRTFTGLLDWYTSNKIQKYPKVLLENRVIMESTNFIESALRLDSYDEIIKVLHQYPEGGKLLFGYLMSANRDRRQLERALTWNGYQALVRNKFFRHSLRPYGKFAAKVLRRKKSKWISKCKGKLKNIVSWFCFGLFSLVPKKKNIWVVSGFRKNTYMDNTRYFYEYVLEHHPEVQIYWATKSKEIYDQLTRDGRPVLMMRTWNCIRVLSRAKIAVVDHYAVADFEPISGFNDGTKVVQLWHGVGFKSATNKDGSTTTGEPGVQPSSDILPQPEDGTIRRFSKKLKYFRRAYYRERYEKYLLFLTPGEEMINRMAIPWKIPESSYFTAGYPRLKPVLETIHIPDKPHILYAPTYRWNPKEERRMVDTFLSACKEIHQCLEDVDGILTIRLHPHTWRNYKTFIFSMIRNYDRIQFDEGKDVYHTLANYSIVISDYSSIVIDFATLNRPTIYFCPDYETYKEHDAGLVSEFEEQITGPLTFTWEDTLSEIRQYVAQPDKDQILIRERCHYFYNAQSTTPDSSGAIVAEIKRRIGWE